MFTLQGIIAAYVSHENACSKFAYLKFLVPTILLEIVVLYGVMGWDFFRGRIPTDVWQSVENLIPPRLDFAVGLMMLSRMVLCLFVGAAMWRAKRKSGVGGSEMRGIVSS